MPKYCVKVVYAPNRVRREEEYMVSFVGINESFFPFLPCWCRLYQNGEFKDREFQLFSLTRVLPFTFKVRAGEVGKEVVEARVGATPFTTLAIAKVEVEVV